MTVSFTRIARNNTFSVKTSKGTFKWWRELEIVDFVLKGKRKWVDQAIVKDNTEVEALRAVIRLMDRN